MPNLKKLFFFISIIQQIISIIEIPLKTIDIIYKNSPKIIKKESLEKISFFQILQIKEDLKISSDRLIYLTIKIGNPQKEFNLLFDTGSIALWVPDKNSDDKHPIKNHFDKTYSKTFNDLNENFDWKYGSGNAKGYYGEDYIHLNNISFIHTFGVAYLTDFKTDKIDGIIGSSRKFYYKRELLFINQLYRLGKIKNKIFSVKNKNNSRSLFIGEEHEDFNKKNIGSCSLSSDTNYKDVMWTCKLQGFLFGNYSNFSNNFVQDKNYSTIFFDTGTNFIIFPYNFIDIIYNGLNDKKHCEMVKNQIGTIICTQITDIKNFSLIYGYYNFHIPNDYLFQIQIYKGNIIFVCKILFSQEPMLIIGMPFFDLFHTLFDGKNNQLKFYSDIAEITYIKDKMSFLMIYGNYVIVISVIIIIVILLIALFCIKSKYTSRDLNVHELSLNNPLYPQNNN